ncbi:MAG: hypothetical protein II000_03020 [Clostridia bacterium]|nr:hypothetical protein [Clostridia bacterium]MBQ5758409.1 hypothetical protein [Clostridia bacterium]
MNKSIYSLVLNDEIIKEIDRLAYENATSRSNMVNQILAEHVSYVTPEQKIREVFKQIEDSLISANGFQSLLQPSFSMYSLRSSLNYKYNPTVKYCVEMNPDRSDYIGDIRVTVRSQSDSFRLLLLQFFKLWKKIEEQYGGPVQIEADSDKFVRKVYVSDQYEITNESVGRSIADYIRYFDYAMKQFFDNVNNPVNAISRTEDVYRSYLLTEPVIL